MSSTITYDTIRKTVTSHLPNARVILFGSRAKNSADRYSDYDLLIITPVTFTPQEKIRWATRLDRALVEAINAPVDLLLDSQDEIDQKLDLPEHVLRSVLKEGITL